MKIVLRVADYVLGKDECGRQKTGRMAFFCARIIDNYFYIIGFCCIFVLIYISIHVMGWLWV